MNEMIKEFLFFGAAVSIMGYELGLFLKAKFKSPIFNPLLISIIAVMIFLSVFHIDYESYNLSARYLSYLLTPATVCLAVAALPAVKPAQKARQGDSGRDCDRCSDHHGNGSGPGASLRADA